MSNHFDKGEIILYQTPDNQTALEVRFEGETIWLTQVQIVTLFSTSKANVSEHIKQIYKSKELDAEATVRKFRTVQIEGTRSVSRNIDYYNLDMIISIGYRVNSIRGTQFRIWANKILKDYLLKGYAIHQRIERIENDVYSLKKKADEFDLHINTSLPPHEGIFYDGQIFNAYKFISDIIKSAKQSIVLIDNYVDESTLLLLSKREKGVSATVYTSNILKQLQHDLKVHNTQYEAIEIKTFTKSHDRFLIIDGATVYHIGASLKDLGKKWFAFSKIDLDANEIVNKLEGVSK